MRFRERVIEGLLFACSAVTILTTIGVVAVLLIESIGFFQQVSLWEFLTDTQWTPLFTEKHFGILPLLSGTILVTVIACLVAVPLGLFVAIYLNEYCSKKIRRILKPLLEMLAAVPTVVYGYFALLFVTPLLQNIFPGLSGFNALSPGIVMGIMILPIISSLSEDALHAVPKSLREGAYALGSSRFQTMIRVIIPAAFSGIVSAILLAVSRAIGETMIVAIAAGQQPRLTLNPFVSIETASTYIIQVSSGDTPHGSLEYQTIFAVGLALFLFTFLLNHLSFRFKKRFHQVYV